MSRTLPAATAPQPRSRQASTLTAWDITKKILAPVASLKVTVVLMFLAMLLIFAGTLAQKESGIEVVVDKYFRSVIVWIPLRTFFLWSTDLSKWVGIPFPGGYTIGFALLINLLAAHIVRFQASWRRIGIWVIHIGIILLMVGELLTGIFQVEARMVIEEGRSTSFVEDHREFELAFIDSSAPDVHQVAVVPAPMLRRAKKRISDDRVPVQIEVVRFLKNSKLEDKAPDGFTNPATEGAGVRHFAVEQPEVSGVDPEQKVDLPSAYVRLFDREGNELGVWLASFELKPQAIKIGDKRYEMSLRSKRTYKPYTIHLQKFTHDVYTGTDKPKDFRSHVRLIDPTTNTDREVEIYMNTPLRYGGETFYQSSFLDPKSQGATGTILQVVHNPAWTMPYISCSVVVLGMLIHFSIVLARFLNKETTKSGYRPIAAEV